MCSAETTEQRNKSYLRFYDNQLKEVKKVSMPYGGMEGVFYTPYVYKNFTYFVPKGLGGKKDLGLVVELNMDNFELKNYKIDQISMDSVCADDKYVYTCNNLNGTSHINRCNKETGKVKTMDFENEYVPLIFLDNKSHIYAFSNIFHDNSMTTYLYKMNSNLDIIKKVNITKHSGSQSKVLVDGDTAYFSNATDSQDNLTNVICEMNLDTLNIKDIPLPDNNPADIVRYKDKLFISHCNLVLSEGNNLSIYDLKQKKVIKTVSFEHNLVQIQIKEDKLIASDGEKIYLYQIKGNDFVKQKEETMQIGKGEKEYYYFAGFFTK